MKLKIEIKYLNKQVEIEKNIGIEKIPRFGVKKKWEGDGIGDGEVRLRFVSLPNYYNFSTSYVFLVLVHV